MRWIAAVILTVLWLILIAIGFVALPAAAGDRVALAPAIWADYQIYLKNLGANEAYYAVTPDGLGGAPSGCSLIKCLPGPSGGTGVSEAEAIKRCEDVSPPSRNCIIFAKGAEIVVDYEMRAY
ncbi:MAG: hypothetical protein IPK59_16240 [Rhodospirillaceae bacterium]|nr:hypothetical protein [Rhodospirillaceae bacterium]